MKVEVLYFKGCPNHDPAVEQVRKALRSEGLPVLVSEVEITDPDMAQKFGFLGSPSIRIDGIDVEPAAREIKTFGFGGRTYYRHPSKRVYAIRHTSWRGRPEAPPKEARCRLLCGIATGEALREEVASQAVDTGSILLTRARSNHIWLALARNAATFARFPQPVDVHHLLRWPFVRS